LQTNASVEFADLFAGEVPIAAWRVNDPEQSRRVFRIKETQDWEASPEKNTIGL